jgi:hypothetical protein
VGNGNPPLPRSAMLSFDKLNAGRTSGILHGRIDKLEADALYQDDLADQLEHTGNGKSGAVVKVMNAMGGVGAAKFRIAAEKFRAEAARLRELAQIESPKPIQRCRPCSPTSSKLLGHKRGFVLSGCREPTDLTKFAPE